MADTCHHHAAGTIDTFNRNILSRNLADHRIVAEHTLFKHKILALSEHLTVYVSSNDRALLMSRVINRGRRLGESTLDPSNPDQWDEAASTLELVTPGSEQVSLIDITPVNRTRNFHPFRLETPEFFDDLYLRLSNDASPKSRLLYSVTTSTGAEYWVLTQGR